MSVNVHAVPWQSLGIEPRNSCLLAKCQELHTKVATVIAKHLERRNLLEGLHIYRLNLYNLLYAHSRMIVFHICNIINDFIHPDNLTCISHSPLTDTQYGKCTQVPPFDNRLMWSLRYGIKQWDNLIEDFVHSCSLMWELEAINLNMMYDNAQNICNKKCSCLEGIINVDANCLAILCPSLRTTYLQ